jgi:NTE family protein
MIPLMIKFPKKRMVFFWGYQSYLLSSDYTNEFQPFNIAKGDFGVAAAVFKERRFKPKLVLLSVMKACFFFNFVLGLWFKNINNFMATIFLSIAANSYINLQLLLIMRIFKKNHINFSANVANLGDNIF